jgi:hypothetical protein
MGVGRSEKGLLGRDPVTPGEALGTGLYLAQYAVFEVLVHHFGRLQAKLAQRSGRPSAVSVLLAPRAVLFASRPGRLRDQKPCPDLQEGSGTFSHHSGTTEGTGQRPVKTRPEVRLPAADLGSPLQYRDSTLEAQAIDGPAQKGGASPVGLQEDQGDTRPLGRHHETGKPTP